MLLQHYYRSDVHKIKPGGNAWANTYHRDAVADIAYKQVALENLDRSGAFDPDFTRRLGNGYRWILCVTEVRLLSVIPIVRLRTDLHSTFRLRCRCGEIGRTHGT